MSTISGLELLQIILSVVFVGNTDATMVFDCPAVISNFSSLKLIKVAGIDEVNAISEYITTGKIHWCYRIQLLCIFPD